jgi:hypothetical protein
MKRFKGIVLAAFAVLLAATYALPASVSAQSAALSIPPKKNYIVDPGDGVKDTLLIRNIDTTKPLQLYLRVIDFTYTDQSGTPKLMLAEDAPQTTWSAKPFLSVPQSIEVPAGGNASIPIEVNIPQGQGAGSYYSAIIYSTSAPDGGNVGLAASGVTLAFISIPGKVSEDLQLKKLGAYDITANESSDGYRFITADEPKAIGYTLENKGNVTASPVGSITLKDLFGRETVISDINPNGSLALIGQSRTFTACIKIKEVDVNVSGSTAAGKTCDNSGLWPGLYAVTADIFYGQNGNNTNEIVKTAYFWYLPLWFIIAVIIILLIIAYFIFKLVRKIKGSQKGKIKMPSRRK